jgi:hypothetical protein
MRRYYLRVRVYGGVGGVVFFAEERGSPSQWGVLSGGMESNSHSNRDWEESVSKRWLGMVE